MTQVFTRIVASTAVALVTSCGDYDLTGSLGRQDKTNQDQSLQDQDLTPEPCTPGVSDPHCDEGSRDDDPKDPGPENPLTAEALQRTFAATIGSPMTGSLDVAFASDDPVSYDIIDAPKFGAILDFNTESGAFTYAAAMTPEDMKDQARFKATQPGQDPVYIDAVFTLTPRTRLVTDEDRTVAQVFAGIWKQEDGVGNVNGTALTCQTQYNSAGSNSLGFRVYDNSILVPIFRYNCETDDGKSDGLITGSFQLTVESGKLIETWLEPVPESSELVTKILEVGTITADTFTYKNCLRFNSRVSSCTATGCLAYNEDSCFEMRLQRLDPAGSVFSWFYQAPAYRGLPTILRYQIEGTAFKAADYP